MGRLLVVGPKGVMGTYHTYGLRRAFAQNIYRFYHIYMVCAFLAVIITYFGVNYLLGGMHSYA